MESQYFYGYSPEVRNLPEVTSHLILKLDRESQSVNFDDFQNLYATWVSLRGMLLDRPSSSKDGIALIWFSSDVYQQTWGV